MYNITNGSNHLDANGLQPRIERSLTRSQASGVGSFARFTGTVRILEAGDTSVFSSSGTYIMQAKGKHSGGGGAADPAICLYLARPVFATDSQGKRIQVSFDIYREQIIFRGGSGSGRKEVFLTNIKKNVPTNIVLEVGFRKDPNDSTKKIHYADAIIGDKKFNWNIPEPEKGLQSGIRYGAYRVKGGRAQIRWANTTYQKKEVTASDNQQTDENSMVGNIYSLKNVATEKYLTDVGVGAKPVVMSNTDEQENTHWSFVKNGNFFNIDSQTYGILRGTGSTFSGGAYAVVSTSKAAPASDSDKIWTMIHDTSDNTYRFESSSGRYLYHNLDGTVSHNKVEANDSRSKWILTQKNTLSASSSLVDLSSIRIFPNPAKDNFIISSNKIDSFRVEVYDILGKTVFNGFTNSGKIQVKTTSSFKSGIYLVQVTTDSSSYRTKLVIE